ncbi:MAG: histidinol-phosphate transaminase [Acidobacteriota bacterium]
MTVRIPDHIRRIGPYVAGKPIEVAERQVGLKGMIKLASNENPLGPSPRAVEAIRRAATDVHRYPDSSGETLRRALAERLGVPLGRIVLGNGSTEIVELLAKAFLLGGGSAVAATGAFIMYGIAVRAMGARLTLVPLKGDRHDLEAMAAACDPSTALVYVGNPNNPTGTYVTRQQMRAYFDRVPEGVLTVLDEAYRDYVLEEDYADGMEFLRSGRSVVLLRTFSKIHGLAGLRIGYAVTEERVAEALQAVRSPFNTSVVAQMAALAALDDGEHVVRSREANAREVRFLQGELARRGVEFVPSAANFLLVRPGIPGEELHQRLLRHGVIVRPLEAYGLPDAVRVTAGTRPENLRFLEALDRSLGEPEPAGGGRPGSS